MSVLNNDNNNVNKNKSHHVNPLIFDNDYDTTEKFLYFNQSEIESSKKCLANMKILIKDYELQIDWRLNQYLKLRKLARHKSQRIDDDLITIQLDDSCNSSSSSNEEKSEIIREIMENAQLNHVYIKQEPMKDDEEEFEQKVNIEEIIEMNQAIKDEPY